MSTQVRHIEEDIVSTPVIALLGIVSTILITVGCLVLIGIYYKNLEDLEAERFVDAEARTTPIEAKRAADHEVLGGYYDDADSGESRVIVPIERGIELFLQEQAK